MIARRKKLLIVGLGLAAIVFAIILARPREPRYQGRPLHDWLADLSHSNYETQRLARVAIKEMGPAAVPFLTNSLAQRDSLSVRIYQKNIIPKRLVKWAHNIVKWHTPMIQSRNAAAGLQALGPDAGSDAIPHLLAAMRDPSSIVASSAALALGSMGTNAIPALEAQLTAATPPTNLPILLQAVSAMGTNAAPLVHQIAPLLASSDSSVPGYVHLAFSRIGPAAIPALTNFLTSTNKALQNRALTILSSFGSAAQSATDLVISLTRHPDSHVRLNALQAFATSLPSREISAPVWLQALQDSDTRNIEIALSQLTRYPTNVRAYNREIALLAKHPTNSISAMASNALTRFHAWPTN